MLWCVVGEILLHIINLIRGITIMFKILKDENDIPDTLRVEFIKFILSAILDLTHLTSLRKTNGVLLPEHNIDTYLPNELKTTIWTTLYECRLIELSRLPDDEIRHPWFIGSLAKEYLNTNPGTVGVCVDAIRDRLLSQYSSEFNNMGLVSEELLEFMRHKERQYERAVL